MRIRAFTENDSEEITGLMKQLCSISKQKFDEERWKQSIDAEFKKDMQNQMIVAIDEEKNTVSGMALASIRKTYDGFLFGNISNLIVNPIYRREGIGEQLLRHSIDFFKQNHINSIRVTIRSECDESVMRLFKKLNFNEMFKILELEI